MNRRQQSLMACSTMCVLALVGSIALADGKVTAKRSFVNEAEAGRTAFKLDIELPDPGNAKYTWLKIIDSIGTETVVPIPNDPGGMGFPPGGVAANGGTISGIVPALPILDDEKIMVLASLDRTSATVGATEVTFRDVNMDTIIINDTPSVEFELDFAFGSHSSGDDGFGGSSEQALILRNTGGSAVDIRDFTMHQGIDGGLFVDAIESGMIPMNLYRDPTSAIGTGISIGNIMSDFVLQPGDVLAFHLDSDLLDPNEVVTVGGFFGDPNLGLDFGFSSVIPSGGTLGVGMLAMLCVAQRRRH